MSVPKNNNLLETARELRKNMTPQERHLWYDFLRYYPAKIYKQRIIDSFIVDFYCAGANLVIELDGSQHYEPQGMEYDAQRTAIIESFGLKVIRFSNAEINTQFDSVCEEIDRIIKERTP